MTVSQPENNEQSSQHSNSEPRSEERRQGPPDRRRAETDRRNAERLAQDPLPRRDPERGDRRS